MRLSTSLILGLLVERVPGQTPQPPGDSSTGVVPTSAVEQRTGIIPSSAVEQPTETIPSSAAEQPTETIPTSAVEQSTGTVLTSAAEQLTGTILTSAIEQPTNTISTSDGEKLTGTIPTSAVEQSTETIPTSAVEQPTETIPTSAVEQPTGTIPTSAVEKFTETNPTSIVEQPTSTGPTSDGEQPTTTMLTSAGKQPTGTSPISTGEQPTDTELISNSELPTDTVVTSPIEQPTRNSKETQANSIGVTTLTSPSSTATGESIPLNLKDVELGENANTISIDGKTAIVLTAPPNGRASFTLNVKKPLNLKPGKSVRVIASIRVEEINRKDRRHQFAYRGVKTESSLQMFLDEASIYDEQLTTTDDKFQNIESSEIQSSDTPKVQMIQESGAQPVRVTVRNVKITQVNNVGILSHTTGRELPSGEGTSSLSGTKESGKKTESGVISSSSIMSTGSLTVPEPTATESNAGGHNYIVNEAGLYVVPLIAAYLV